MSEQLFARFSYSGHTSRRTRDIQLDQKKQFFLHEMRDKKNHIKLKGLHASDDKFNISLRSIPCYFSWKFNFFPCTLATIAQHHRYQI